MKNILIVALLSLVAFIFINGCSTVGIQHSVLESSPYIDHGMNDGYMRVNGRNGIAASLNGYYNRTITDSDTSIQTYNCNIGFRGRFYDVGDGGIGFNVNVVDNELYGYGIADVKFYVLDDKMGIYPYIGFGAGMGTFAWSFDIRTAMIFRVNIIENTMAIHAAPRLIGLLYPYYEEVSGNVTLSYSYSVMPMYGVNAGLEFTIPFEEEKMFFTITPDMNLLFAQEPQGDEVSITVFQAGCSFGIAF